MPYPRQRAAKPVPWPSCPAGVTSRHPRGGPAAPTPPGDGYGNDACIDVASLQYVIQIGCTRRGPRIGMRRRAAEQKINQPPADTGNGLAARVHPWDDCACLSDCPRHSRRDEANPQSPTICPARPYYRLVAPWLAYYSDNVDERSSIKSHFGRYWLRKDHILTIPSSTAR